MAVAVCARTCAELDSMQIRVGSSRALELGCVLHHAYEHHLDRVPGGVEIDSNLMATGTCMRTSQG